MKSWQLAVLGLAPLLITGCRSDPAIPILERELHHKDLEINQLQCQIEDLQDTLNSCPERGRPASRTAEEREPEPKCTATDRHEPDEIGRRRTTDRGIRVPTAPPSITNPTPTGSSNDGPTLRRQAPIAPRSIPPG